MNFLAVMRKFAWLLLIGLIGVGLACVFVPPTRRLRELQRKKAELREENLRTQELINQLKLKQKRFRTDAAFVERVAREMGRVKPEEVIFKLQE